MTEAKRCNRCGRMCKGNRGLGIHQIHCEGKGVKAEIAPKKRRTKKITLRDLQEQITAIETRIEIAVKILMGV